MSTSEEVKNRHTNATALLVAAAKKSGLFEEVPEALCFIDKNCDENPGLMEALYDDLADAFDDNICLPALTIEGFYGEGFNFGPYTEAELAPYLG